MPKRRQEETDTEYIKRKLRRLQKKLKKLPSEAREMPQTETVTSSPTPKTPEDPVLEDDVLPEEFLLALGTEGEENDTRGPEIRAELANRWTTIMTTGLGKDIKEKMVKKYPGPENFFKEAPKINPEIMVSLSDVSRKRDNRIVHRQNLTLTAMTALGKTLTNVLKGNINSNNIIEEVNDAAKILAEIYFEDSNSRKFFALAGANPVIKEAVRDSKPDEFLFGKECAEKIKAAQAIKKTGSQIKNPEPTNNIKPAAEKQQPRPKKQGNWKGPSQQYHQYQNRGRGGLRQVQQQRKYIPHQRDVKQHHYRTRHTYRR